jgi:hypothetical protein
MSKISVEGHPTAVKIREKFSPEYQEPALLNLQDLLGYLERYRTVRMNKTIAEAAQILGLDPEFLDKLLLHAAAEIESASDSLHFELLRCHSKQGKGI